MLGLLSRDLFLSRAGYFLILLRFCCANLSQEHPPVRMLCLCLQSWGTPRCVSNRKIHKLQHPGSSLSPVWTRPVLLILRRPKRKITYPSGCLPCSLSGLSTSIPKFPNSSFCPLFPDDKLILANVLVTYHFPFWLERVRRSLFKLLQAGDAPLGLPSSKAVHFMPFIWHIIYWMLLINQCIKEQLQATFSSHWLQCLWRSFFCS